MVGQVNPKLTEIIFLLDRSGSMTGLESDTIGGFNSFIKRQCDLEGETILTAILFDDQYEVLWDGIPANQAVLTKKEYYTRGATALLDAVGKTIVNVGHRLSRTKENQRPGKIIFVITTDGLENSSREFTYKKVSEMILHQQEKYSWEFIFMAANMDAAKEAGRFGISSDDAFNFEASHEGMEKMYDLVCKTIAEKRKFY